MAFRGVTSSTEKYLKLVVNAVNGSANLSFAAPVVVAAAAMIIITVSGLDKLLYVRTYVQFIDEFLWLRT